MITIMKMFYAESFLNRLMKYKGVGLNVVR